MRAERFKIDFVPAMVHRVLVLPSLASRKVDELSLATLNTMSPSFKLQVVALNRLAPHGVAFRKFDPAKTVEGGNSWSKYHAGW
jgi:hypothetical protein